MTDHHRSTTTSSPPPTTAPTRRRYDESASAGPKVKRGLDGELELSMWAIFRIHQPAGLARSDRSGWAMLSRRVDAAMKARGFGHHDAHSAILRFYNNYIGCTMHGDIVIGLADALGIAGVIRRTFVVYGLLLRGRADTRRHLYQTLVSEGCIPTVGRVGAAYRMWRDGSLPASELGAYILPQAATISSPS